MLEPPVLPYFEARKHTMCCFKLICITVLAVYSSSLATVLFHSLSSCPDMQWLWLQLFSVARVSFACTSSSLCICGCAVCSLGNRWSWCWSSSLLLSVYTHIQKHSHLRFYLVCLRHGRPLRVASGNSALQRVDWLKWCFWGACRQTAVSRKSGPLWVAIISTQGSGRGNHLDRQVDHLWNRLLRSWRTQTIAFGERTSVLALRYPAI